MDEEVGVTVGKGGGALTTPPPFDSTRLYKITRCIYEYIYKYISVCVFIHTHTHSHIHIYIFLANDLQPFSVLDNERFRCSVTDASPKI